jgi:hypothetical protein
MGSIFSLQAHNGALNCFVSTFKHIISAGDDGILLFIDLESCHIVRRMDVLRLALLQGLAVRGDVIRRLKCLSLREDPENGGTLAVGTSYGDVYIIAIGTCV